MSTATASKNYQLTATEEQLATSIKAVPADQLVIVMYQVSSLENCVQLIQVFKQLAVKYQNAAFFVADVDKCPRLRKSHKVVHMPTFVMFRGETFLDKVEGALPDKVENMVKSYYNSQDDVELVDIVNMNSYEKSRDVVEIVDVEGDDSDIQEISAEGPGGRGDLFHYLDMAQCECLNGSDASTITDFLTRKGNMVSDCDEQLILSIRFNHNVKINGFKIRAPLDLGPKTVKVYANLLTTLDFDTGSSQKVKPLQTIILTPEDLEGKTTIELSQVRFRSVSNLQLFIVDNQSGDETTEISWLSLYGAPLNTKRGVGKAVQQVIWIDD